MARDKRESILESELSFEIPSSDTRIINNSSSKVNELNSLATTIDEHFANIEVELKR